MTDKVKQESQNQPGKQAAEKGERRWKKKSSIWRMCHLSEKEKRLLQM